MCAFKTEILVNNGKLAEMGTLAEIGNYTEVRLPVQFPLLSFSKDKKLAGNTRLVLKGGITLFFRGEEWKKIDFLSFFLAECTQNKFFFSRAEASIFKKVKNFMNSALFLSTSFLSGKSRRSKIKSHWVPSLCIKRKYFVLYR